MSQHAVGRRRGIVDIDVGLGLVGAAAEIRGAPAALQQATQSDRIEEDHPHGIRRQLCTRGAPTLAPPRAAEPPPPPPPAPELAELRAQESDAETLSALCAAQLQHPQDEVARAIGVLASRLARRVLSP